MSSYQDHRGIFSSRKGPDAFIYTFSVKINILKMSPFRLLVFFSFFFARETGGTLVIFFFSV